MGRSLVFSLVAALISFGADLARAQSGYEPYFFTTLAGVPPGKTDGRGAGARFQNPQGVVMDSAGKTFFVVDPGTHSIRRITSGGQVTTYAGRSGVKGYVDGPRMAARFNYPVGVAVDRLGNCWVADAGNSAIRKIAPDGTVSTFVGGTVGTGSELSFDSLMGIAVDADGNIFVTDNETVRKVTPAGVISTLAGNPGFPSYALGQGAAAYFDGASGIIVDNATGLLIVADTYNGVIRSVTPAGYAGVYSYIPYSGNNTEDEVPYYYPTGLAIDSTRNVYVADPAANTIRRIESGSGNVHTIAGSSFFGYGSLDATGTAARFSGPTGLTVDSAGNIYVADAKNAAIRKIDHAFAVSTIAGLASNGATDGLSGSARFAAPYGVTVDGAGNVYAADTQNHTIRKITPFGVVTTLAGQAGFYGNADGNGNNARFSAPKGVAVDSSGNVFVADTLNNSIRKITPAGDVTTIASLFAFGSNGAVYGQPEGIAVDGAGNLYASATNLHAIYKIAPGGNPSVFAGTPGRSGYADGSGSTAQFYRPSGITLDSSGNIYVADMYGNCIRKITPGAVVSTLPAGPFYRVRGVAVDGPGNIFFTVSFDDTIRKMTPAGIVSIVGGSPGARQHADGSGSDALFWSPSGIATDSSGSLYIGDTYNNVIRIGRCAPPSPKSIAPSNPQSRALREASVTAAVKY